jgi:hypothetical protein
MVNAHATANPNGAMGMASANCTDRIAELLRRRADIHAAAQKCKVELLCEKPTVDKPADRHQQVMMLTAFSKDLRRIKSRLFYLRHRRCAKTEGRQHGYQRRRYLRLRAQLDRLASLPDDQFVNQTRTAGHVKRVLTEKLRLCVCDA